MNRSKDVDAWMASYDNPQHALVQEVRLAILAADPRITEAIKWQAPTFVYKGNIASFFPKAKKHVSLMFHKGAEYAAAHRILEGDGKEARAVKFADAEDFATKRAGLEALVRDWCDRQDAK